MNSKTWLNRVDVIQPLPHALAPREVVELLPHGSATPRYSLNLDSGFVFIVYVLSN